MFCLIFAMLIFNCSNLTNKRLPANKETDTEKDDTQKNEDKTETEDKSEDKTETEDKSENKTETEDNNADGQFYSVGDKKSLPDNDAFNFVKTMRIGWNLGNALDSYNNDVSSETAWGNPKITQKIFRGVKKAGFEVVRIPVTWLGHIGNAPDYKIEDDFLDRVFQIVGYAKQENLKVIINIHHDGADSKHWLDIKNAAKNSQTNDKIKNQLSKMWEQIAKKFPNSQDYLIFEVMNEIHDGGWGFGENKYDNGKQYSVLNEWNQICVDSIRKTGATNFISVPGYVTNPELTMKHLILPKDSLNKIFVTVHSYNPSYYAIEAKIPKWGSSVPVEELTYKNPYGDGNLVLDGEKYFTELFGKLYEKYIKNGIPVLLSECGATYQKRYENYRRYYVEVMVKTACINGIVPILWDNGLKNSGKECFGYFDRTSGEIYNHAEDVVSAAIKAATKEYNKIKMP